MCIIGSYTPDYLAAIDMVIKIEYSGLILY